MAGRSGRGRTRPGRSTPPTPADEGAHGPGVARPNGRAPGGGAASGPDGHGPDAVAGLVRRAVARRRGVPQVVGAGGATGRRGPARPLRHFIHRTVLRGDPAGSPRKPGPGGGGSGFRRPRAARPRLIQAGPSSGRAGRLLGGEGPAGAASGLLSVCSPLGACPSVVARAPVATGPPTRLSGHAGRAAGSAPPERRRAAARHRAAILALGVVVAAYIAVAFYPFRLDPPRRVDNGAVLDGRVVTVTGDALARTTGGAVVAGTGQADGRVLGDGGGAVLRPRPRPARARSSPSRRATPAPTSRSASSATTWW